MTKYIKKPVVLEAMELTHIPNNQQEIIDWGKGKIRKGLDGGLIIETLEGNMVANSGAYIIRGIQGEFYPCKSDIFEQTYSVYEGL